MGHPQPTTTIKNENLNSTVIEIIRAKKCRSRDKDMIFYWVKDRVRQGHFCVF